MSEEKNNEILNESTLTVEEKTEEKLNISLENAPKDLRTKAQIEIDEKKEAKRLAEIERQKEEAKKASEFYIEDSEVIKPILRPFTIFFAPIRTFKSIRKDEKSLVPILILLLITIAIPAIFVGFLGEHVVDETINMLLATNPNYFDNLPPDFVDMQMSIMKYSAMATYILQPFGAFISAFVIWIVVKILSMDTKFKKLLEGSLILFMVSALMYLINVILFAFTGHTSLTSPVTNLATIFTNGPSDGFLYFILFPLDLLTIWVLVLKYNMLRIVGKFSKKAATIYMICMILFTLYSSILSGLSMMMKG